MTWYFFKHYLFSRFAGSVIRTMAWICLLGVGVGVLAMVVVLSVMNGFGGAIRERLFWVEPHLVVEVNRALPQSEREAHVNRLLSEVAGMKGVRAAAFEKQDVIVRTSKGQFRGAVAKGMARDGLNEILSGLEKIREKQAPAPTPKIEGVSTDGSEPSVHVGSEPQAHDGSEPQAHGGGEPQAHGGGAPQAHNEGAPQAQSDESTAGIAALAETDGVTSVHAEDLEANDVLMGIDLARALGIYAGEEVVLISPEALLLPAGEIPPYERVKVKDLIRSNVPDIDSQAVYYRQGQSLKRLRNAASMERGVELRVPNPEDYSDTQEALTRHGWNVHSWEERNSALFYSLRAEKMLMTLFLGLTIFIASFSIVIVLVLLGIQKRKDIGVLMAMGLSSQQTQKLFTQIGMLLSGSGMLGGLMLGLLICLFGRHFNFIRLPDIYYDTRVPFEVNPWQILFIIAVGSTVSFVAAYVPARLSSRMTPSRALRE